MSPDAFTPHQAPKSTGALKDGAIRLPYGDDAAHFGDLRLPAGPGPHRVAVLIHGGGWQAIHHLDLMDPVAEDLTARGWATWNIEYRRLGQAGGGWPGTFLDASRAVDHLATLASKHDLDLGRVVAVGHSAGGHLVLWLAARSRIPAVSRLATGPAPFRLTGVVSLAGSSDLARMWSLRPERMSALMGGTPSEVPDRYTVTSPIEMLPLGVPQILVHGTDDRSVPVELSRDYVARARAAGDEARLVELPGVDHFAVIYPPAAAWARTLEALAGLGSRPA